MNSTDQCPGHLTAASKSSSAANQLFRRVCWCEDLSTIIVCAPRNAASSSSFRQQDSSDRVRQRASLSLTSCTFPATSRTSLDNAAHLPGLDLAGHAAYVGGTGPC